MPAAPSAISSSVSRCVAFAVLKADPTLHHLGPSLANREPEPRAALLAGRRRVRLVEAAENARPERLGNAGPFIVHADAQPAGDLLGRDPDDLAFRGKLGGV